MLACCRGLGGCRAHGHAIVQPSAGGGGYGQPWRRAPAAGPGQTGPLQAQAASYTAGSCPPQKCIPACTGHTCRPGLRGTRVVDLPRSVARLPQLAMQLAKSCLPACAAARQQQQGAVRWCGTCTGTAGTGWGSETGRLSREDSRSVGMGSSSVCPVSRGFSGRPTESSFFW